MPKVSKDHMDARRRQILDAAATCFARVGFHTATMQDVIRESGLSAGAIYNYFSSKEDIVIAIAQERHDRENRLYEAALEKRDPDETVRHLTEALFRQLTDPALVEERRVGVQLWAEALNNKRLLKITKEGTDQPRRVIHKLVDGLKRDGAVPDTVDTDALSRAFVAMFEGYVLQKCREPNIPVDDYVGALLFLWDRLRDAPAKKRSGKNKSSA